ncbi:MAG: HAMP domain-containing methyl-accepting chemotaxis protein [Ignavibacteriales bacterium]|nr:HAMP domain-containing methyl-accepting chemotaxis protein [Ignavibacteriales bacterium]
MKWFLDLKTGTKLLSGFVLVACIAGLIGFVGYTGISAVGDLQNELYQERLIPIADLGEANENLLTLRGNILAAVIAPSDELRQKYLSATGNLAAGIDRLIDKYAATKLVKEEEEGLKKFRDAWSDYKPIAERSAGLIGGKKNEEAVALIFGQGLGPVTECRKNLADLIDINQRIAEELDRKTDAEASATLREMVFFVIVGVVIAIALGLFISRIITGPLKEVITNIDNADLNSTFHSERKDELGDLQRSFDGFVANIKSVLMQVAEVSSSVASASAEISSSTEQMAAGAQEQSSQATEVASSVEEMTKTIVENSQSASKTAETARESKEAAEIGKEVMEQSSTGMRRIADVVNRSAVTIKELGKSSDHIGEIISVIDDIADQTNLLALNAAIEAARAGEQGRGFAVVADEVRKLAERTTRATKEIASMIKEIQSNTKVAVDSMEEGTKEVENGIQLTEQAGAALGEIVSAANNVTMMVAQIAAASEEQSKASEEIAKNVDGISSVMQETTQGTQQIAKAADDLNQLTEALQELVGKFNLDAAEDHARGTKKEMHGAAKAAKPKFQLAAH